jgi:hypothetical protein
MKNVSRIIAGTMLLAFALTNTACGKVTGTIGGKKKGPVYMLEKGAGSEIVSSSQQSTLTVGGYKVQSSAGNTLDKLEATTAGGYKVQMTVQGVILE